MNLFSMFQISGSALSAERLRAEIVTSNLANSETTRTPEGGPYQRRMVVFQRAAGGELSPAAGRVNGSGDCRAGAAECG